MKIEEGKSYKTRDGRKASDVTISEPIARFKIEGEDFHRCVFTETGRGNDKYFPDLPTDVVSLWPEEPISPIQSKTVKSCKEGNYGNIYVFHDEMSKVINIGLSNDARVMPFTASELRAAALTFAKLADFLEENEKES